MKKTDLNVRVVSVAAALTVFAATVFADMATPSPSRSAQITDGSAGNAWAPMIGVALWIVAGIIVAVWIWLKLSKRSSK